MPHQEDCVNGRASAFSPVDSPGNRQRIVVGVDGSTGSFVALRWAITEARVRDVAVHAVLVNQLNPSFGDPGLAGMFAPGRGNDPVPYPPRAPATDGSQSGDQEPRAGRAGMTNRLDGEVSRLTGIDTSLGRHVQVTQEIVVGHAAEVLLATVAASDLLVVGAHGYGGLGDAMLGSVSRHVVSHARCPVVVVADPERAPR